jgi:O-antigen/teichoic acid export membrane protein
MSVAGLLTTVLGIVRALLLPKLLGTPADYGLLLIVSLITGFGAYAHLGTTQGIYRQIPYLRGRGVDEEEIARLRNSTYGFVGLMSLIAVAAVFLLAGPSTFTSGLVYAVVISGGAFMVLLTNLTALLTNLYQADRRFDTLARFEVALSFTSVGVTLVCAAIWGVVGVIVSQVTVQLVFLVLYRLRLGLPLKPRLRGEEVWRVMRVGLPLTVMGFLRYGLENVDAVVVARFMGGNGTGYFKLALTLGVLIRLVPAKLGMVIAPDIAERTGAHRLGTLRDNVLRFTELNAYLAALLAVFTAVGIRVLLPIYLPSYTVALPVIYVFLIRTTIYSTMTVAGNTMVNQLLEKKTVGRWIGLQVGFVLVAGGLTIWVLLRYGSLLGVVLAGSAVIGVYVLVLLFFTIRELELGTRRAMQLLGRTLLPICYLGLLGWGVFRLLDLVPGWAWPWRLGLGLVVLAAAALPLVLYEEKRLHLFGRLRRYLFAGGPDE